MGKEGVRQDGSRPNRRGSPRYGDAGSNLPAHAGQMMSGPASGGRKRSSAFAWDSTASPRPTTDTVRAPLWLSKTSSRERQRGHVTRPAGAGGRCFTLHLRLEFLSGVARPYHRQVRMTCFRDSRRRYAPLVSSRGVSFSELRVHAEQPRMAKLAVHRPFDERDLHDDLRPHPVRAQARQARWPW